MNSSGRVLYVQSELFLPGNPPSLHANEQGSQPSSMTWIDGVPLALQPFGAFGALKGHSSALPFGACHPSAVVSCCPSPSTSSLHFLLFFKHVTCCHLWTWCFLCWGHSVHGLSPRLPLILQLCQGTSGLT